MGFAGAQTILRALHATPNNKPPASNGWPGVHAVDQKSNLLCLGHLTNLLAGPLSSFTVFGLDCALAPRACDLQQSGFFLRQLLRYPLALLRMFSELPRVLHDRSPIGLISRSRGGKRRSESEGSSSAMIARALMEPIRTRGVDAFKA